MIPRDFQLLTDQAETPYSRQLHKGFRWLRFEPELELEFAQYLSWNSQMPRRAGLILALVMWCVFLLTDRLMIDPVAQPGLLTSLLWVRLGVIAALLLAVPLAWTPGLRHVVDRLVPIYLLAINLAVQACALMFEMHATSDYLSLGIILGVLALFAPMGQSFWSVMGMVALSLVSRLALKGLLIGHLSLANECLFGFYIINVVAICGFAFYLQDHSQRQQFLGRRLLGIMAEQDGLTGLTNRRYFMMHAQRGLLQARRDNVPVAMALIDVDDFKAYNDAYGHPSGDQALQHLAGLLRDSARRPLDIAARMGGEEFALMLFDCSQDAALARLEELRRELADLAIDHRRASTGTLLTMSVGLANCMPGQSLEALYRQADKALYEAKSNGRDGIVVLAPATQSAEPEPA